MARRRFILAFYRLGRFFGLFQVARWLTRSQLRILCYHGFVLDDEDRFRATLFVDKAFFEDRMRYLRENHYPVLHLDDALARVRKGALPSCAVAITIDDGFHSVFAVAREVLQKYQMPATLYLTSYYFQKGTPIFQLAVDYMCWKSPNATVDLSGLGIPEFENATALDFSKARRKAISEAIFAYGSAALDEPGRVTLSRRLAERLAVDYDRISETRIVSLVSDKELVALQDLGMRMGLHTHRHRFPNDAEQAQAELKDNRAIVEPVTGKRSVDFCYPNGDWSRDHWPLLKRNGIETATTCDPGLVYRDTAPYGLPRILDDNRVSKIEFEAELSGFSELIRRLRRKRAPRLSPPSS
jgi:peptidoglycan/xylan/chitin deacetylase (PgdA/CDA1 family)